MDEEMDGGDGAPLRARQTSGAGEPWASASADRGADGGVGDRDDGGGDRDGSEPPAAAKPKRKRAAPGTGARRRGGGGDAAAAADGASSGDEDAAACAAQDGGRGPASARCAARRALVAELREACAILCMALDATQQLWASDEVAALAAGAVPQARADEKAARAILGGAKPKAKGKPRGGGGGAGAAGGVDEGGWRAAERDALRKALAVLGLGRPRDVADALAQAGPASAPRRSDAEVDAATAAYLRSLEATGLDGVEGAFVARHLKRLSEAISAADADAAERAWPPPQPAQARTAVRRLQLLEQLGTAVAALEAASPEAADALRASAAADEARLPRWWSHAADVALLRGVRAHGFGAYAAIRGDPALNAPFAAAEGVARSAAHASRPKAAMAADEEEEAVPSVAAPEVDRAVAFPAPDTLTARVKRLTDAVLKALRAADPDADADDGAPGEGGDGAWSKRERERLLKALLTFGMPPGAAADDAAPEAASADWGALRAAAALRRSDADVARAAAELRDEAARLTQAGPPARGEKHAPACRCATCASRRRRAAARAAAAGEEPPPPEAEAEPEAEAAADGADVGSPDGGVVKKRFRPTAEQLLSAVTAKQLSDRLALLTSLRAALAAADAGGAAALQRAVAALGRSGASADAPPYWWRPGQHDLALARGTLQHGYGAWARIADDASLPFRALLEAAAEGGDPLPPPSSRAVAKRLKLLAQAHAAPPPDGDDDEYAEPAQTPPPKRRRAASAGVAAATAALAAAEQQPKGRRRRAAMQAPPEEEEEQEAEAEEEAAYYDDDDDEGTGGEIFEPF